MSDDKTEAQQTAIARFLAYLEETGDVTDSADRAWLDRSTLYRHKRSDPDFARRWNAATAKWKAARLDALRTSGDWRAHLALLERHENARLQNLERRLKKAQAEQAELRNRGELPADNLNVRVAVDPAALAAKIDALAAGLAAEAAAGAAGDDPGKAE